MKLWLMAAPVILAVGAAVAGGIEIEEPWARASLGRTPNSAAYMVIRSGTPDRLIGAASPIAERVEVHNTTEHAGVSQMRPVEALEVGPDRPAVLQPGGLHLMLMGLTERLVEGRSVPLQLSFEEAGTIEIEAEVRGLGGADHHGASGQGGGSGG
jgi:periplasmic copper chaperone A